MPENSVVQGISRLSDAVQLIAQHYRLQPQAQIENYPYPSRAEGQNTNGLPGAIFAYQFFDAAGGHCASWLVDDESVHLFATPHKWGSAKDNLADLSLLLQQTAND
jgi:hypothetical protein